MLKMVPNPIRVLCSIRKNCIRVWVAFQRILQCNADWNNSTKIKLLSLLEDHSTAAVAVANCCSVPEASAERFVWCDLAEEFTVWPNAGLMRHNWHPNEAQVFTDQAVLVVAPTNETMFGKFFNEIKSTTIQAQIPTCPQYSWGRCQSSTGTPAARNLFFPTAA